MPVRVAIGEFVERAVEGGECFAERILTTEGATEINSNDIRIGQPGRTSIVPTGISYVLFHVQVFVLYIEPDSSIALPVRRVMAPTRNNAPTGDDGETNAQ